MVGIGTLFLKAEESGGSAAVPWGGSIRYFCVAWARSRCAAGPFFDGKDPGRGADWLT